MNSTSQDITAEELIRMPDSSSRRYLVRGEIRRRPYAGGLEGAVAFKVAASLGCFIRDHAMGDCFLAAGFVLNRAPDTVLAPCFAYLATDPARDWRRTDGYLLGPPDLACEVTGFTDTYAETQEKVELWLGHGCKVVIVFNPKDNRCVVRRRDQRPTILQAKDDQMLTIPDLLPGWSASVQSLFE